MKLRLTRVLLPLVSAIACSAPASDSASDLQRAGARHSVVEQIDHILIESLDAHALFAFLSDTLQLPVAWPMSEYGSFASGGIAVGNVNLEVLNASEPLGGGTRSRFIGFALEPAPLMGSLPELQARGIPYGEPAPFRSNRPFGVGRTLWTTVGLPAISDKTTQVFLCEYEHDVAAARRQSLEQLRSRNGGPLSLLSVRELVYGTTDVARRQGQWQALLRPVAASAPGVWPIGDGPAIRVIQAARNGISELVIVVESLPQARQFLAARGLLGREEPGRITLGGPALEGLNITLVQDGV